jgi:hypothetical protein
MKVVNPLPWFAPSRGISAAAAIWAALLVVTSNLPAQPIVVPNASFETPSAPTTYPPVTFGIDSWQKAPKPAYFDAVEQGSGLLWDQTAAIFFGPGAYANMAGFQAAYLFSFPQVSLFQDYDSVDFNDASPTHEFDVAFEIGKAYTLTVGLYGKGFSGPMTEGSLLGLSFYYRSGTQMVTVGNPTIVSYTANSFPVGGSLNLIDYQVTVPTVQAGEAWAGQKLGIKVESIYGTGDGYWDIDNVRLTAVPEPGFGTLLALGAGAAWGYRRRQRA